MAVFINPIKLSSLNADSINVIKLAITYFIPVESIKESKVSINVLEPHATLEATASSNSDIK